MQAQLTWTFWTYTNTKYIVAADMVDICCGVVGGSYYSI